MSEWLHGLERQVRQVLPPDLPPGLVDEFVQAATLSDKAPALLKILRSMWGHSYRTKWVVGEVALELCRAAGQVEELIGTLVMQAHTASYLGRHREADELVAQGLRLWQEAGLGPELEIRLVNCRSANYTAEGDLISAFEDLHYGLKLALQLKHPVLVATVHTNLGWLQNLRGEHCTALYHLKLVEEWIAAQRDTELIAEFAAFLYENRAQAYLGLARQARERQQQQVLTDMVCLGLLNVRDARQALRTFPDHVEEMLCYAHQASLELLGGNVAQAEGAALDALTFYEVCDQRLFIEPLLSLAEVRQAQGRYAEAQSLLERALHLLHEQQRWLESLTVARALMDLHEVQEQYLEAIHHARRALDTLGQHTRRVNLAVQLRRNLSNQTAKAMRDAHLWQLNIQESQRLARLDPLTGLLNRRGLEEELRPLQEVSTSRLTEVLVCVLDVDHFKQVNDRYSHAAGDLVLAQVAHLLREAASRLNPGHTLLCRYGGEEFVLVIAGIQARTSAFEYADHCRASIAQHDWSSMTPGTQVTVSCGYSLGHPQHFRSIFIQADHWLYRAKQTGRNRVCPDFLEAAPS